MAEATTTTTTTETATTNGTADLGPAVKIDVTEIAKPYREEVRAAIRDKCGGVGPKLVAFLANTVCTEVCMCVVVACVRVCLCLSVVVMAGNGGRVVGASAVQLVLLCPSDFCYGNYQKGLLHGCSAICV